MLNQKVMMRNTSFKTMRDVLMENIYDRMGENEKIFFLTADFGAPALDKIRKEFKNRFINVGIAEQNLINVATGLALEGYIVYAYAIAAFITMRAYEQIRMNLSISSQAKPLNVNLIGVGTGLSYDMSGPSHHCLEDISIMRLLPNLVILSPSDWKLVGILLDYSIRIKKPKYIRLDGKPLPAVYKKISDINIDLGFHELVNGKDICLVSTGVMTHLAVKIANRLKKNNIGVIDIFLLKPVNDDMLFSSLSKYKNIITIEEAFINSGGLDNMIANIITSRRSRIGLDRFGINNKYVFDCGERDYLHRINKLDEDSIIRRIKELIT